MAQLSITTTRTTTTTTVSTTTTTTTISTSTHYFSSLILPYLLASCSFVASNPLYFSYLIFFSPYILKILSFLSPLFLTTSLFLLAFVALHKDCLLKSSESKVGALLGCDLEEEDVLVFRVLEELEACMVALDSEARNNYGFSDSPYKESALGVEDKAGEFGEDEAEEAITLQELAESQELALESLVGENPLINQPLSSDREQTAIEQRPLLANNVKELKKIFEKRNEEEPKVIRRPLSNYKERKTTEEPSIVSNDKETVAKDQKPTEQQSIVDNAEENKKNSAAPCSTTLTPCVSMRKDREWKRTLACKLYEERHNKYGDEGMDSLWEEYEADSGKHKKNGETVRKEYDEEDGEDDETDVKICCLQALKLSSGRMNMGMKKPSLLKISKALKGIGWLHSVGKLGKEKAK